MRLAVMSLRFALLLMRCNAAPLLDLLSKSLLSADDEYRKMTND